MTPNKTPLVTSQLPIPQISRHPTRSYSFRFTSLMTHPSSYDLLHHSSSTIFSLLHSSSTIISLLFMFQSSVLFPSIHVPIISPFPSIHVPIITPFCSFSLGSSFPLITPCLKSFSLLAFIFPFPIVLTMVYTFTLVIIPIGLALHSLYLFSRYHPLLTRCFVFIPIGFINSFTLCFVSFPIPFAVVIIASFALIPKLCYSSS